jgi:hypothetical protein
MAKVRLKRSSVGAFVRQRKATGVAQHVRMQFEGHSGLNACPLDQLSKASDRERRTMIPGFPPSQSPLD